MSDLISRQAAAEMCYSVPVVCNTQPEQLAAARLEAQRGRYCIENAEWHRSNGRTHLAVRVADDADFSCVAMRRNAIDAVRKESDRGDEAARVQQAKEQK